MSESIVLPLRHTYAQINQYELNKLTGIPIDEYNDLSTTLDKNFNISDTTFFLKGTEIPEYLNNNLDRYSENDIITIVDSNIMNLYWKYRELLSLTDLENLKISMDQPLPTFENVNEESPTSIYYLNDNITQFNVLHITVKDFIKMINNNALLKIKLSKIDVMIILSYELYDFYNYATNTVEDYISR